MTSLVRWVVVTLLVGHGLVHLLGALKGFGWTEVPQLKQPIGPAGGVIWLLAMVLVLAAAGLIAAGAPTWWWVVAALAAVVSQVAIITSWSDARVGTAANVLLVLAAVLGFASLGPTSFPTQYRDRTHDALADSPTGAEDPLTEQDLAGLPEPLADYVRRSGALGRPRVVSFSAHFHGRIRSGPDQAWMPFTGEQLNTFGPRPQRIFLMDAIRSGLPVTVLHSFEDATATMRAKVLSLFTVVDASGPEMDRGETVTVFNDLVVLAPAAIVGAPVRWTDIDARHVRGDFTNGDQIVSAELTFDANHDLVDFVSEDRLRTSADGKTFARQTWSTPLTGHRESCGRRVLVLGQGRWEAPEPEGAFTYVELHIDDITYNVQPDSISAPLPTPAGAAS
ncbi:MAG: hypothetical protein JWR90_2391 [Marmoricola sp.]|nr:hypothetical protein [Marmoricola sp.]